MAGTPPGLRRRQTRRDRHLLCLRGEDSTLLTAETATSITLRGQDGKEHTILRSDLDELASTAKSLMPEGLEGDLSRQDLADVIAFVRAASTLPLCREFSLSPTSPRC